MAVRVQVPLRVQNKSRMAGLLGICFVILQKNELAMDLSPILLFVYNRPGHTREAVESLLRNPLAAESELFVYSDGAKDEAARPAVEAVRRYVRGISGFKKITLVERENNWGLARNIINGVTSVVNRCGKVIVLEDDLVVAPHFLEFMNDALETYKDEPRVGHVHACEITGDQSLPDSFLVKWVGSWGWGTWQRAWKLFNPDGKALLNELERRGLSRTFDFDGKYGYTRMLRRQTEGKNNSWAIRWNATLFLQDILSVNVGKSLVQNKGFDGSGTHCGKGGDNATRLYGGHIEVKRPVAIKENMEARAAFVRYYARTNSFMAKALRRIKRTLKGDFGA